MESKRGRPKGTTKANGYKVAQDCDSYWRNRTRTYKKTSVVEPSMGFLTKVGRGLDVFLSPFNQVS